MDVSNDLRTFLTRAVILVIVSTFILTSTFVGILAVASGDLQGTNSRIPFYAVVTGVAFVGTMILIEMQDPAHGRRALFTATSISIVTFIFTLFTVEGILFSIQDPERVFVSQLVYYLLTAGLIATGFGYWALNHWREIINQDSDGL